MSSETEQADLLSRVEQVSQTTEITYRLFHTPEGYGLAASVTDDPADRVRIDRLTTSLTAAKRVFALLSENTVFPYNIREVLDDLLAVDPMP